MVSLTDIKKQVEALAALINAPAGLLPTYGTSKDFAHPHLEVDHRGMHWVVVERGQEQDRKTTDNIHQFLYWIFDSITFSMSVEYELNNRIEDKDCRRIMFAKQEELMGTLHPEWGDWAMEEHREILMRHPFDDLASLRATYCGQLRKQGYAEEEINRLAYAKYPAP